MKWILPLVASLVVAATAALSSAPPVLGGPPKGVWTCDYIASHPIEAALASVSCSPKAPPAHGNGPFMPSALDQTFTPDVSAGILSNGCNEVPLNAYVGQGVFAWTPEYYYANVWSFDALTGPPEHYTWYIQKTNGQNVFNRTETDSDFHFTQVAYNVYRSGAQNHSADPAQWYVCHYD